MMDPNFSHPPSYGIMFCTAILALFAIANLKSMPLVYTFRVLPSVYRILHPRLFRSAKKTSLAHQSTPFPPNAASPALFHHHTSHERAIILDLDVNMHKSNSTFFADADLNRAALLSSLLGTALAELGPASFILAATSCKFGREIAPLQAYDVSSRILTWDEKSLWVVTYFLRRGMGLDRREVESGPQRLLKEERTRKGTFATMVSRYVFKAGRETVRPARVLFVAGLLVSRSDATRVERPLEELWSMEEVEQATKSGMEYVKDGLL